MNQESILELLKKVDTILQLSDEETSVKEKLEAIKLKLDIIKSLDKIGYQIPKKEKKYWRLYD